MPVTSKDNSMSEIRIKRGDQGNLDTQDIKDGEMIFAKDTENLFMSVENGGGVRKRVLLSSNIPKSKLTSGMIESIIDGRKWDGSHYIDDVIPLQDLFTELHNIDNHYYYVLKHNRLYRYPKMIYFQRDDKLTLYKNNQGFLFSIKQLMDGEAYEGFSSAVGVGKWKGKVGELIQNSSSHQPYYQPYYNRLIFDGSKSYMSTASELTASVWELEFELGTYTHKTNSVIVGSDSASKYNIWLSRQGYLSYRDHYYQYKSFGIPTTSIVDKRIKLVADGSQIKLYLNGMLSSSITPHSTIIKAKNFMCYRLGNYGVDGSLARLIFRTNNEMKLDLEI